MIRNIPSTDDLDRSALTSFFAAWHALMQLFSDFDHTFGLGAEEFLEEISDYYEHCHVELETCYTLAAQASELGMKARICEVSPFLLLSGGPSTFKNTDKDIDFSELRTLDATDLPSAVNAICAKKLSDRFIQKFKEIRRIRNKISHLGGAKEIPNPIDVMTLLVEQYVELWPERGFLPNWLEYIASRRFSYFHDGKWNSAELELSDVLATCFRLLSSSDFKRLIGYPKGKRRYMCHKCMYSGSLDRTDFGTGVFETAFLTTETTLICQLCQETTLVRRQDCNMDGCFSNVISIDQQRVDRCHKCGVDQSC